ncbi:MAG: hypothetical protein R3B06_18610 [Kofleriaceae bacterium]
MDYGHRIEHLPIGRSDLRRASCLVDDEVNSVDEIDLVEHVGNVVGRTQPVAARLRRVAAERACVVVHDKRDRLADGATVGNVVADVATVGAAGGEQLTGARLGVRHALGRPRVDGCVGVVGWAIELARGKQDGQGEPTHRGDDTRVAGPGV